MSRIKFIAQNVLKLRMLKKNMILLMLVSIFRVETCYHSCKILINYVKTWILSQEIGSINNYHVIV